MRLSETTKYTFKTWFWIAAMVCLIVGKGFLAFFVIGDKGQPTWDYRPVVDVPSKSEHAIYQLLPHPQHVRGREGN